MKAFHTTLLVVFIVLAFLSWATLWWAHGSGWMLFLAILFVFCGAALVEDIDV